MSLTKENISEQVKLALSEFFDSGEGKDIFVQIAIEVENRLSSKFDDVIAMIGDSEDSAVSPLTKDELESVFNTLMKELFAVVIRPGIEESVRDQLSELVRGAIT